MVASCVDRDVADAHQILVRRWYAAVLRLVECAIATAALLTSDLSATAEQCICLSS